VRTSLLAISLVAALAACDDDEPAAPAEVETVDVYTAGDVYLPFTTVVSRGGIVRFHITRGSDDDGHNAIFNPNVPGVPPDIPVVMDTTVARTFTTVGTFHFVCTVHPGMASEIVVE
jgi:plastocyanin